MMHMQEIKERHHQIQRGRNSDDEMDVTEIDPMVPNNLASRRLNPESWMRVVMNKIWPVALFVVACLGMYEVNFVSEILHSSTANRNFVHLSIIFGTLLGGFACYIEVYRSIIRGEHVRYESAKTATHGMMASMLASGLCAIVGMWPVWHWLTLPYLFMWSWGVVLQLLVILPPFLQRIVFGGAYLWFMHSYLSQSLA
ncbi:putative transmembrane protein [Plasmopara halstedii]